MERTLHVISFFLVAALLSGCGWHLRGSQTQPLLLAPTYLDIKKGSASLRNELREALQGANVALVTSVDAAELVLTILDENEGRRVLSVGTRGRVSDYELQYSLTFSVRDKAGTVLIPKSQITQQRDYSFDESAVLAKGDEERQLFDFMRRTAIQTLMRRLQPLAQTPAATHAD